IATDTLLLRQKLFTGTVDEILFHDKSNRLTVLGDDGITATIDLKRMEVLYNTALLFNNSDFGFSLYTPKNYYLVSPEFVNEMHFVKGTETYALSQFDLQLNRPDKVLEQIGYTDPELLRMYAKAYERRLQKAGFNVSSGGFKDLPPVICRSAELSGTITEDSTITLQWSTAASAADIAALRLYINGQIIQTISQPANEWTIPVSLNLGDNNIEASYLTKDGVESLPASVSIQYAPAKSPVQKTIFIGIGVSHYQDTVFNLTYAAKDAGDLAKKFQQSRDANIYTFLDAQVTRAMLDSIRRIVQSTSIHDQVILSFSGHGLTDNSYKFFFGSHDIDFTNPGAKGISYADITTLLDDVPARKKLILIDACHSGETDASVTYFGKATTDTQYVREKTRSTIGKKSSGGKMMNTVKLMEQYFADLSTASGTNVLSAAAGEEYALESSQWANGVFTYSVINGIFEKQADKNSDGKVMLSELRKYVQEEVLKLTGGKQQPTSRNSNPRFDWAL
ncbi:MAG TPA: caspase family protein, partial [Phnomibacter sp.]|nr:caspase family protein [Phnomibacter sp.]